MGIPIERTPQSLCWRCENCVPNKEGTKGCSWSIYFRPVKGWDATPIPQSYKTIPGTSYRVNKCPEFVDAGYDSLCVPIGEQRRRRK